MINPLYDSSERYSQLKKTIELETTKGNDKVLEYHATLTPSEVMFINTLRIIIIAHNIKYAEVFMCQTFNELLSQHNENKKTRREKEIETLRNTDIAAYIIAKKVLHTKKEKNYFTKLYTLCDTIEKYYKNISTKELTESMFSVIGREYPTTKGKMFEGIKIMAMPYQNAYRIQVSGIIGGTFDVYEQKLYDGVQVASKTKTYIELPTKETLINDILCEWFLTPHKTTYRHTEIADFCKFPTIKRDSQGNGMFAMSDSYAYPIYQSAHEYLENIADNEINELINRKLSPEIYGAIPSLDDIDT